MDSDRLTRRRFLLRTLGSASLLLSGLGNAQRSAKPPVIGVLANHTPRAELELGTASPSRGVVDFVEELRQRGWEDGRSVRIVWRSAEGRMSRHPQLVRELVRMPVDVIVCGDVAVNAAMHATRTIPVVAFAVYDPIEKGYARSLNHPGGNLTGINARASPNHLQKPLALLKEAFPRVRRVALVAQASQPQLADHYPPIRPDWPLAVAARALDIELFFVTFGDPRTLPEVVRSAARQGAGALMVDANYAIHQHREIREGLNAEVIRLRLPVMHLSLVAAGAGALMSYGADPAANWRRAAQLVDRILRGGRPGDIPIEHTSRLEFHVNLKAARAMGVDVPRTVLLQADKVFE